MWDLDYITSKQHTKIYAQMVQELADYAQKIHVHVLCKPGSTLPFTYFIAKGSDGARILPTALIE